jgi:signal transduction histidine kinase
MTLAAAMLVSEDPLVNHEFINCLTSVKCLTDLLVTYPKLDADDRNRFLNILGKETDRLVRLAKCLNPAPNTLRLCQPKQPA